MLAAEPDRLHAMVIRLDSSDYTGRSDKENRRLYIAARKLAWLETANHDKNITHSHSILFAYHWIPPSRVIHTSLRLYKTGVHLDLVSTRGSCLSIAAAAVAF